MAIKPDDKEIGALYREAGGDEPSAELDRAILQAARNAVAPRPVPASLWRRWRLHIPVLASLFMVALFSLLITLQQPETPTVGQIALNETPPASQREQPARTAAAPAPAESRARMAETVPAAPAAKLAAPARMPEAAQAAAPAHTAAGPSANTISPAADAAAPAMEKAEARAPVAAVAAPTAAVAARAAAPAAPNAAAVAPTRPASEWLESIQKLLDQERIAEAKASLDAFRKIYPGVPIPAAIRERLQP